MCLKARAWRWRMDESLVFALLCCGLGSMEWTYVAMVMLDVLISQAFLSTFVFNADACVGLARRFTA
jgi:hypothetical protein